MGRFRLIVLATASVLLLAHASAAFATVPATSPNKPSSAELVQSAPEWDGREIRFTGEAIAQAQKRGGGAWIHLNDDAYYLKNVEEGAPLGGYNSGHAVWLPRELAEKIGYFGDYTHEGDVVTVVGVFNAACGEHGGDMDIHATQLEVDVPGHVVREPIKSQKAVIAAVMLVLGLALALLCRRAGAIELFGAAPVRKR